MDRSEPSPHRPAPVDTHPSARFEDVLGLFDELAEVTRLSEGLFSGIEQVTGLRVGEVHLLRTAAHEAADVHEIARRIGQTDDAASATAEGLVRRGLLHQERSDEGADLLHLTGDGAALLEQTEGVQVRLLDTLAGELGTEGVDAFRTTLRGVADMLRTVAGRAGIRQTEASRADRAPDPM